MKLKNSENYGFIALVVGAVLNLIMALIKFYVGLSSNCISILADGYNNAADSIGNVVGAVGWVLSRKKADERYTHGYGRFETLITFIIVTISIAVGAYFVYTSIERLFFRVPISFLVIDFILIAVTAVLKIGLFVLYRTINKKHPSPLLSANKLDSVMDATITGCTLIAYGLGTVLSLPIDAFIGIGIGIAIIITTAKLWRSSIKKLLGAEDGELLADLQKIIADYPELNSDGVTDAFVSGNVRIVYVETADDVPPKRATEITDILSAKLNADVRLCTKTNKNQPPKAKGE